ncbi:MAG: hypothetical protein ABI644_08575 [Arenimonas sp.]
MRFKCYEKTDMGLLGVAVLLLTLLCASCGKQQESVSEPPKAASAVSEEANIAENIPATKTKGVSVVGRTNSGYAIQVLKAVRFGNPPDVDRIVFEFNDAGLPEWELKYVEPSQVTNCGSGDPVTVAGNAWLQITFRGAQAHNESGEATSGPTRKLLNQIALRELVRTCDFEGEVTWVAGVMRENEYTSLVLANPSRLVIDIAH